MSLLIILLFDFGRREGDAGAEDSRLVLRMPPSYWRHVAGTGRSENSSRS